MKPLGIARSEGDDSKGTGQTSGGCNSRRHVDSRYIHRTKDSMSENHSHYALLSRNSTFHKTLSHRDDSDVFVGKRRRELDIVCTDWPIRQEPKAGRGRREKTSRLSGGDDASGEGNAKYPRIHLRSSGTLHTWHMYPLWSCNAESRERCLFRREGSSGSSSGCICDKHVRAW